MPHTAALGDLVAQLHTNETLQSAFQSNPASALEPFDVTGHEHDAVVTRDLDDLVAIGVASTIEELPEVLRGTRADEPHWNVPEHLRDRLEWIRRRIPDLMDRNPHPAIPRIPPQPGPGPGPHVPFPGPKPPGPGPDPTPDG